MKNRQEIKFKQVLFVCTGNLYRSKYAEACFNYLCLQNNVTNMRAFSRGLMVQKTEDYEHQEKFTYPIRLALPAFEKIKQRQIPLFLIGATNQQINEYDCESAQTIVLMNKREHMPMMEKQFPQHLDKVICTGVGDVQYLPELNYDGETWDSNKALDRIELDTTNLFSKMLYRNL